MSMTAAVVVGTRPELIKRAPVLFVLEEFKHDTVLIHTGQHYDENLSAQFFTELGLRQPSKADCGVHDAPGNSL